MKRKSMAALAASVLVAASLTSLAPADGGVPDARCATKADYYKVRKGQTRWQVRTELNRQFGLNYGDSYGGGFQSEERKYRPCTNPRWGHINVTYWKVPGGRLRVDGKWVKWTDVPHYHLPCPPACANS